MTDSGVAADGSPVAVHPALPEFAAVIEMHSPHTGVRDLGCGVGRLANRLATFGPDVVALDSSPEMLARHRLKVRRRLAATLIEVHRQ